MCYEYQIIDVHPCVRFLLELANFFLDGSPMLLDLKPDHRRVLSMGLNTITPNNFEALASACDFSRDEIQRFSRAYAGGGNPAKKFFEQLSKQRHDVTCDLFMSVATKYKRNDIPYYLKKWKPDLNGNMVIFDLPFDIQDKLCEKLNDDWQMFAGSFGFNMSEIKLIEATIRDGAKSDPTDEFLTALGNRDPYFTLEQLKGKLKSIQRNDLAIKVDSWIDEYNVQ